VQCPRAAKYLRNKKYIYFGLVACLALLVIAQSNSYAIVNNLAGKGIVLDGKDNYSTSFKRKQIDLDDNSDSSPFSEKGKKFYGTSPCGKDISIFYLWIGRVHDLWYKYVLQER